MQSRKFAGRIGRFLRNYKILQILSQDFFFLQKIKSLFPKNLTIQVSIYFPNHIFSLIPLLMLASHALLFFGLGWQLWDPIGTHWLGGWLHGVQGVGGVRRKGVGVRLLVGMGGGVEGGLLAVGHVWVIVAHTVGIVGMVVRVEVWRRHWRRVSVEARIVVRRVRHHWRGVPWVVRVRRLLLPSFRRLGCLFLGHLVCRLSSDRDLLPRQVRHSFRHNLSQRPRFPVRIRLSRINLSLYPTLIFLLTLIPTPRRSPIATRASILTTIFTNNILSPPTLNRQAIGPIHATPSKPNITLPLVNMVRSYSKGISIVWIVLLLTLLTPHHSLSSLLILLRWRLTVTHAWIPTVVMLLWHWRSEIRIAIHHRMSMRMGVGVEWILITAVLVCGVRM